VLIGCLIGFPIKTEGQNHRSGMYNQCIHVLLKHTQCPFTKDDDVMRGSALLSRRPCGQFSICGINPSTGCKYSSIFMASQQTRLLNNRNIFIYRKCDLLQCGVYLGRRVLVLPFCEATASYLSMADEQYHAVGPCSYKHLGLCKHSRNVPRCLFYAGWREKLG
jgi:hypothetical protein